MTRLICCILVSSKNVEVSWGKAILVKTDATSANIPKERILPSPRPLNSTCQTPKAMGKLITPCAAAEKTVGNETVSERLPVSLSICYIQHIQGFLVVAVSYFSHQQT